MGLGFSKQRDRPVAGMSCVHSDNVIGDPSSLSDTRLKQNQQAVPLQTLASIFAGIETKQYDFHPPGANLDGTKLPSEHRIGFVADGVKAAIGEEWRNILGTKPVNGTDYLTLDYSRLVCVLWGVCKGQKQRLEELEARVSNLEA